MYFLNIFFIFLIFSLIFHSVRGCAVAFAPELGERLRLLDRLGPAAVDRLLQPKKGRGANAGIFLSISLIILRNCVLS
jgi:hypothetical protein